MLSLAPLQFQTATFNLDWLHMLVCAGQAWPHDELVGHGFSNF